MKLTFSVPGTVTPWARSRSRGPIHFTAKPQEDYMQVLRSSASAAMAGAPMIEGPVELTIVATWPWPKGMSAKKRLLPGSALKPTKPDVDNITKIIKDSLNLIVWRDDAQVTTLIASKRWGETPGLWVQVTSL